MAKSFKAKSLKLQEVKHSRHRSRMQRMPWRELVVVLRCYYQERQERGGHEPDAILGHHCQELAFPAETGEQCSSEVDY